MPVSPVRPAHLRGRVFRGSTAVRNGWLTPKQLRGPAWRRLRQDVYADARLDITHRVLVTAVGLTLPPGAGFAGVSAAAMWGQPDLAGAADPVEVVLPPGRRWSPAEGVRVRALLAGRELVRRGRWLCTSRVDTAVDLIRFAGVQDGVVLLDRLVRSRFVALEEVRRAVENLPACPGRTRARKVAGLADGLAESEQETRLRLLLHGSGLPASVAQHRIFDTEGFVAKVDLAFPDWKIAIEYDGLWHGERRAFLDDRRRLNRLVAAGWIVLHVTVADLQRPEQLLARLRALIAGRVSRVNTR